MKTSEHLLTDAAATEALGAALASRISGGATIYLIGDLGAGKTTLVRGFLRALGHAGAVKSPTYTLVEPYQVAGRRVYHFDLYRLADPEELEYLGAREYFDGESVCLIEWPEQGRGMLPSADLTVTLEHRSDGRWVRLEAAGAVGEALIPGSS